MSAKKEKELYEYLYEKNVKNVYEISLSLLRNKEQAQELTINIFKEMFASIDIKEVNKDHFKIKVLEKTIGHCKNIIVKDKPKAYNIPLSKNRIIKIEGMKELSKEQFKDYMLDQFNDLERLIYVMTITCHYSMKYICKKLNIQMKVLKSLLDSQEYNVMQMLTLTKSDLTYKEMMDYLKRNRYIMPEIIGKELTQYIDNKTEKSMKKRKYKIITACIAVCAVIAGLLCCFGGSSEDDTTVSDFDTSLTYTAYIDIEDYGTITVELDDESAPITVENFVNLAEEGFYDGLTFHRIIEDFMMQGGDPNGDGTGGSENTIAGEFTNNGYDNSLSHTRGAISMARSSENDSASSQFFIVHEDSTYLDGDYAVFGYVSDGMDIVDAICESVEPTDDNGTIESEDQPVITSITIVKE